MYIRIICEFGACTLVPAYRCKNLCPCVNSSNIIFHHLFVRPPSSLFFRTVYDATTYTEQNPGVTNFPASSNLYTTVGRLDDKRTVEDFAVALSVEDNEAVVVSIADNLSFNMLKTKVETSRGGGVLVCGSPNEVAPDPELDDYFEILTNPGGCPGCVDTLTQSKHQDQKRTVWTLATLEAEDQLCQVSENCVCSCFIILSL